MAEDGVVVEGEKGSSAATMWRKLGMTDCVDAAMDAAQAMGLVRSVDVPLGETELPELPIGHHAVLFLCQVSQPRM